MAALFNAEITLNACDASTAQKTKINCLSQSCSSSRTKSNTAAAPPAAAAAAVEAVTGRLVSTMVSESAIQCSWIDGGYLLELSKGFVASCGSPQCESRTGRPD